MDVSIWQILAIEPTTDIKEIKQAYAAKLKTLTIDQQLEEFQELKTAFDLALTYARSKASQTIENPSELLEQETEQSYFDEEDDQSDSMYADWDELKIFSVELRKIEQEQAYFDDLTPWDELTDQIFDWGSEEYWENQYLIQLFLLNNYRWLSRQVIDYLIALFDLDNLNEQTTHPKYVSHDFIQHLYTMQHGPLFSFDVWRELPPNIRVHYFASRYEAWQLLTSDYGYSNDPFSQRIDQCLALTKRDADIYALLLLKLLSDGNGEDLSESNQQQFKFWMDKAINSDEGNQTILFLQDYYALTIEKSERPPSQKIEWDTEQLFIPKPLIHLLYEKMLFQQEQYTAAFTVWKKLSRDHRLARLKKYNTIRTQLPQKEREELQHLNQHLHKQTEQYKNKQAAKNNMIRNIFVAAVVILAICGIFSGTRNSSKKLTEDQQQKIQEHMKEYNQSATEDFLTNDLLKSVRATLKKTEQARSLTKALYSEEEVNVDELFANEELRATFDKQRAVTPLDFDYNSEDFSYYSRLDGQEMLRYISIYHLDEFLYVITVDETNATITAVYGNDWEQLPKEEVDGLIAFTQVEIADILVVFINEYLFSENKAAALEDYGVYFSAPLRTTLEKNLHLPIPENFRNGWLYQVDMDYNEIVYALTNEAEDILYFAFDEENRLHCIYGENWDSEEIPALDVYGETTPMTDILNSY